MAIFAGPALVIGTNGVLEACVDVGEAVCAIDKREALGVMAKVRAMAATRGMNKRFCIVIFFSN